MFAIALYCGCCCHSLLQLNSNLTLHPPLSATLIHGLVLVGGENYSKTFGF